MAGRASNIKTTTREASSLKLIYYSEKCKTILKLGKWNRVIHFEISKLTSDFNIGFEIKYFGVSLQWHGLRWGKEYPLLKSLKTNMKKYIFIHISNFFRLPLSNSEQNPNDLEICDVTEPSWSTNRVNIKTCPWIHVRQMFRSMLGTFIAFESVARLAQAWARW